MQAYINQREFYRAQIEYVARSKRSGVLEILDFGSGANGISKQHLESIAKRTPHHLSLYDNQVIPRASTQNSKAVGEERVFGGYAPPFDIISLSYVLCDLGTEEALEILATLRAHHPQATFTIVDYTLQTRSKAEVLGLLHAEEERKWQHQLGEDEFVRTRSRFTMHTLGQLLSTAGLPVDSARQIDSKSIRAALTANTP